MRTCTGVSVGRASSSWLMAGIAVDGVAAARTRDRRRVPGFGRLGPLRRHPAAVDDDLDIELESLGVDAARREGPDRGSSPVGQSELVAVPARNDELLRARGWEQQPHACRGVLDGQTLEVGAG